MQQLPMQPCFGSHLITKDTSQTQIGWQECDRGRRVEAECNSMQGLKVHNTCAHAGRHGCDPPAPYACPMPMVSPPVPEVPNHQLVRQRDRATQTGALSRCASKAGARPTVSAHTARSSNVPVSRPTRTEPEKGSSIICCSARRSALRP